MEDKKVIWITGASSGIGRALALKFAKEGWIVAASARRESLLQELNKINENIYSFPLDVTNINQCKKVFENIIEKFRNIEMNEGKHNRAKLGFILMSTDLAAESDFFNMIPKDVAIHITRLKTEDYTTNKTLSKHIEYMADAASRIQPEAKPNVISYSCTSGSIVIGEEKIMAEIKKGAPYAIPMTLVTGVVDALRELQIKKIVVGTPYLDEINTKEAEFLYKKGFEIINIQGLNLTTGIEFGKVTPAYWKKFA